MDRRRAPKAERYNVLHLETRSSISISVREGENSGTTDVVGRS